MSPIPLITTSLKGFAALWSMLLFSVSAAFIAQSNTYLNAGHKNKSNFGAGKAYIAGGVLYCVYSVIALFSNYRASNNVLVSVMSDTIIFGIFFVYFLACSSALGTNTDFQDVPWGSLATATQAFGWILTFLILGILVLEVTFTLKFFGRDFATWRTPFNRLFSSDLPSSGQSSNNKTSNSSLA